VALGGYLPPLVTELKGEIRDLAKTFTEGEGLAEAYSEKMDTTLTEGGHMAGKDMAEGFDSEVKQGMDKTWRDAKGRLRDERGKFVSEGKALGDSLVTGLEDAVNGGSGGGGGGSGGGAGRAGRRAGLGFVSQFMDGASMIGQSIVPILIGAAIIAAPAIAAAIGAAIAVILPLAFAGIGAMIAVTMLPQVKKAFGALANPIRAAFKYAVSGAFDDALIGAVKQFGKYIPQFKTGLRGVFDAIAPILKPLADSLGKSITVFLGQLRTTLVQSQPVIMQFLKDLPTIVKSVGDLLVKATEDGPALVRFLSDADHFLSEFLSDTGSVIGWLSGVYDWIVKLNDASPIEFLGWSRKIEGAKIAWNAFTAWFKKAWTAAGDWIKNSASNVGNWFSKLPGIVWNFIKSIPGFFVRMWHDVLYYVGFFVGSFVKELMALPGQLWTVIKFLWTSGVDQFKRTFAAFVALAKWAVDHIIAWFESSPGRALAAFKALRDGVVKFFKAAPGWLVQAGKDLLSGLWEGIKSYYGWLIGKVKGVATDLLHGFKDALDMHSPSRAFAEVGRMVVAGFVQGILGDTGDAHAALRGLVGGVGGMSVGGGVAGAAYAGAGGYGGGGVYEVHTTIQVDNATLVRAITPGAQRRKSRSGTSGLS